MKETLDSRLSDIADLESGDAEILNLIELLKAAWPYLPFRTREAVLRDTPVDPNLRF